MIQANELRIGNYVLATGLHETKTVSIKYIEFYNRSGYILFFNESDVGEYPKDLKPIPLTSEILERCGFDESGFLYLTEKEERNFEREWLHRTFLFYSEEVLLYYIANDYKFDLPGDGWHTQAVGYRHIQYLHQLQNLYYSLTGKELEIKP